jgi:hypothetical protein
MKLVKRLVMGIGMVALVASVLTLVMPKIAHAAVAALVQVVNTPTTAVPAVLGTGAGQLYQSSCNALWMSGTLASCTLGAVPAGYTLLVETVSMHVVTDLGASPAVAYLINATSASYPHSGETPSSPLVPIPPSILGEPLLWVPLTQGGKTAVQEYVGTVSARVWSSAAPVCQAELTTGSLDGDIDCTVWGYLVSQ